MKKLLVAGAVVALLSGCATSPGNYRPSMPIIDMSISTGNIEGDRRECEGFASQAGSPASHAVAGAVAGLLLGALLGKAVGSGFAGPTARFGAIAGGAQGLAQGAGGQNAIMSNCMRGRGWKVLN